VNLARKGAEAAGNAGSYTAPPMAAAAFHPDLAEGKAGALIDLSAAAEGYVAVSATSDKRLKFQVRKDDWTYNYDLASDGTPSIFPLQCGNGHYTFRIMENVTEKKYVQIGGAERDVTLIDEFQPFLRPSDYVDYSPDSACVKKAAELASGCSTRLEVVGAVYNYVIRNVRYDTRKAKNVTSGYLPYPDETMSTGRGICFDYASLTAAMLRSQGVPTKVIFGYVSPDDLYHAWNMFYTEESGWVTVSFEVSKNSWTRLDLTFTANGANDKFVGDGSNYADVYSY
jgi:transglutaminase-like putative cysteine protease